MENTNPIVPVPPNGLHIRITQELNELRAISAMINSRLEKPLNDFMNLHNIIEIDDLESDKKSVDTPVVSPLLDSDDESDDGEVLDELDELDEYGNARIFYHNRIIKSLDGEDLAFPCMIGFRKFVAYFDPFLPMNIITRKAYNTIMVEGLKDIGEFIVSDMTDIAMGRPFRAVTQLEYDCVKGLISFSRIFDTYIFRMPHTIPRLKNFEWSKVLPILVLRQRDLMSRLRCLHQCGGGLILYQAYGNLYAMTGRKAHLLEDKQIPSVGVFDECIFSAWIAFGGNTRDLDSIWEETDEVTTLHEFQYQKIIQWLETASQSMATVSGGSSDNVRILVTSEVVDSKETLRRLAG
ncbi:hypothetical protein Tco_1384029 [Tanacetum coccineum]